MGGSSKHQRNAVRRTLALTLIGVWSAGLGLAALLGHGPPAGRPLASPVPLPAGAEGTNSSPAGAAESDPPTDRTRDPAFDPGLDTQRVRWVGREVAGALTQGDRALLRAVFGIDDVARLFVPAATPRGVLRYAARTPGCSAPGRRGCRYALVRVGLAAPRQPAETWDQFVTRVAGGGMRAWPAGAHAYHTELASLDPEARPAFEQLVAAARRAGFPVRVAETYRSPERQVMLLARADGRTVTATSIHSYGRAVDLVIGDGRMDRVATVRTWIAFRRWVVRRADGAFRLVGTPEHTWDWPHVELAYPVLGFRTVDALVAAAQACRAKAGSLTEAEVQCTLMPHLPRPVAIVPHHHGTPATVRRAVSGVPHRRGGGASAHHGGKHRARPAR